MADETSPAKSKTTTYVLLGGLVLVGVYLAYRWYENNVATNAANAEPSGSLAGDTTGSTAGTTGTTSNPITSFADWIQAAVNWATTNGYDPITAANAVNDYQNGNCLSTQEYSIIDGALGALGFPPGAPQTGIVQCQPAIAGGGSTTTPGVGTTTTTGTTTQTGGSPSGSSSSGGGSSSSGGNGGSGSGSGGGSTNPAPSPYDIVAAEANSGTVNGTPIALPQITSSAVSTALSDAVLPASITGAGSPTGSATPPATTPTSVQTQPTNTLTAAQQAAADAAAAASVILANEESIWGETASSTAELTSPTGTKTTVPVETSPSGNKTLAQPGAIK
jgi:hypothetical protein